MKITQFNGISFQTAFRSLISSWDVWGLHTQSSHIVKSLKYGSVEASFTKQIWKWQWSVTGSQNNGLKTSQWKNSTSPPGKEQARAGWVGRERLLLPYNKPSQHCAEYIHISCFAWKLQLVVFTWFQNYKVLSKTHTRNTNWFHENSVLFHENRWKQRVRISTLIRALEKSKKQTPLPANTA